MVPLSDQETLRLIEVAKGGDKETYRGLWSLWRTVERHYSAAEQLSAVWQLGNSGNLLALDYLEALNEVHSVPNRIPYEDLVDEILVFHPGATGVLGSLLRGLDYANADEKNHKLPEPTIDLEAEAIVRKAYETLEAALAPAR